MSYAVSTPPAPAASRRPVTVQVAAGLLALMALVGLGYAVATIAITPGVVNRFRAAAGSADRADLDAYVTGVWLVAAFGAVLAVILLALYVVLALGLRRGSQASRVGTWVVCGLGLLFGCGTTVAVAIQRSGTGDPAALGSALSDAYPGFWIGLNVALSVAQMVGYPIVALLLAAAPAAFFRRGNPAAGPGAYVTLPTYGSANLPSSGPVAPSSPESGPDNQYWTRPSS